MSETFQYKPIFVATVIIIYASYSERWKKKSPSRNLDLILLSLHIFT